MNSTETSMAIPSSSPATITPLRLRRPPSTAAAKTVRMWCQPISALTELSTPIITPAMAPKAELMNQMVLDTRRTGTPRTRARSSLLAVARTARPSPVPFKKSCRAMMLAKARPTITSSPVRMLTPAIS